MHTTKYRYSYQKLTLLEVKQFLHIHCSFFFLQWTLFSVPLFLSQWSMSTIQWCTNAKQQNLSLVGRVFLKIYPWCPCLVVIGIEQPTADSIWTRINMSFSVKKKILFYLKRKQTGQVSHIIYFWYTGYMINNIWCIADKIKGAPFHN